MMSSAQCLATKAPSFERNASYAVDNRVTINLHIDRVVNAAVKAVIERTDGKLLRLDFGKDKTRSFISGR
jgi:hypothetical protein